MTQDKIEESLRWQVEVLRGRIEQLTNPGALIEAHIQASKAGFLAGTSNWAYAVIRELAKGVR